MQAPSVEAASEIKSLQSKLDEANLRCKKLEHSSAQSKRDQKKHVSTLTKKIAEMKVEINVLKESPSINRQLTDEYQTVIQQKRNLESVLVLQQQEIDRLLQYLQSTEEQLMLKERELATMSERLAELSAKEDTSERLLAEIKSLEEELLKKEEIYQGHPETYQGHPETCSVKGNETVGTNETRYCKKLYQENGAMESLKPQLALVQYGVKTLQNAVRQRNSQNEELKEALVKSSSLLQQKEAELEGRSRLEAGMRLSMLTTQDQLAVSEKQRERLESLILAQKEQLTSYHRAVRERNSRFADLTQMRKAACSELERMRDLVDAKEAELVMLRGISSDSIVLERKPAAGQPASRQRIAEIGVSEQQLTGTSSKLERGKDALAGREAKSNSSCRIV